MITKFCSRDLLSSAETAIFTEHNSRNKIYWENQLELFYLDILFWQGIESRLEPSIKKYVHPIESDS